MKPVIGLTCSHDEQTDRLFVSRNYTGAVAAAGGIPVLLGFPWEEQDLSGLLSVLDGLVLTGGGDVDPVFFGEDPLPGCGEITPERDLFEITLTRLFLSADKPVLGICRGMQVLNIAAGGDIYQDIPCRAGNTLKHAQQAPRWHPTHDIEVAKDATLAKILGPGRIRVNSFHHQAVRNTAPGFVVSARSADGVVEGIECPGLTFIMGIQCHPETMWQRYPIFLELFKSLVGAAGKQGVKMADKEKSSTLFLAD